MCEYIELSKGIYRIKNSRNPYHSYMIEKNYNGEIKRKCFSSLQDCKDQIEEWDEIIYGPHVKNASCMGLAGLNRLVNEELGYKKYSEREVKTVYIYDAKTKELLDSGNCVDIASKYNTSPHNIYNVVREKRLFKNLYNITYSPISMNGALA